MRRKALASAFSLPLCTCVSERRHAIADGLGGLRWHRGPNRGAHPVQGAASGFRDAGEVFVHVLWSDVDCKSTPQTTTFGSISLVRSRQPAAVACRERSGTPRALRGCTRPTAPGGPGSRRSPTGAPLLAPLRRRPTGQGCRLPDGRPRCGEWSFRMLVFIVRRRARSGNWEYYQRGARMVAECFPAEWRNRLPLSRRGGLGAMVISWLLSRFGTRNANNSACSRQSRRRR